MNGVNITVNARGTVKKVSFKIFDYLLNHGRLAAITLYTGETINRTEWFVKEIIS